MGWRWLLDITDSFATSASQECGWELQESLTVNYIRRSQSMDRDSKWPSLSIAHFLCKSKVTFN